MSSYSVYGIPYASETRNFSETYVTQSPLGEDTVDLSIRPIRNTTGTISFRSSLGFSHAVRTTLWQTVSIEKRKLPTLSVSSTVLIRVDNLQSVVLVSTPVHDSECGY